MKYCLKNAAWLAPVLALSLLSSASFATAETLREALTHAYAGNPTLGADRARQRAVDEQVPQALSGWRPSITTQGTTGKQWVHTNALDGTSSTKSSKPANLSINLSQPIFNGYGTVNGVKAAEANIQAGRQTLLATEQQVLYGAAKAFLDVMRDRQILNLRQQNVRVFNQQLKSTSARFSVGDVTNTDVAQSRASLSNSQAQVATAKANLAVSEATYLQMIGHAPQSLRLGKLPALPTNLEAALATASRINPTVLAAAFIAKSSYHNIGVATADLLPTLALQASGSLNRQPSMSIDKSRSASLQGVLSMPLYGNGGITYSQIRAAKQTASQRQIQVIEANRSVRQSVAASWGQYVSADQSIAASKSQVAATELAVTGVREEYKVGTRTTLDVLNAESATFEARIALVNAENIQAVSAYQLLAATGQLTASHLGLSTPHYDPTANYRTVRDKWIGTDIDSEKPCNSARCKP